MNFIKTALIILVLSVGIISCQKDESADRIADKAVLKATDTSNTNGNFMAVSGLLNITIADSTYTFDAAKDSVAFINVNIDSNKYYGITAINKAHTMSFGISSPGFASPDLTNAIAGSQLIFSKDGKQYTLPKNAKPNKANIITLQKYMQDSTLTKGTFITVMTDKNGKPASANAVTGNFNLLFK